MICHRKGQIYSLVTTDNKEIPLQFCHRNSEKKFVDGVTDEELVDVLMDRYDHHLFRDDSEQNMKVITFLREIKRLLIQRTKLKSQVVKTHVVDGDSKRNDIRLQARSGTN